MEPLPWWVNVFYAADRCHAAPWDLIEDPTPRDFWARAGQVLAAAESDARETLERRQSKRR